MTLATAFRQRVARPVAQTLSTFSRDCARGFMSVSRLVVTFVGSVTVVGLAVVLSNETVRQDVLARMPAPVMQWMLGASGAPAAEPPIEVAALDDQAAGEALNDAQQKNVTQYLARRYRVADEAVRQLVAVASRVGQQERLDPTLILAVMAIESSMNPFAESHVGAQGLMQVLTRVHTEKFEPHGGDLAALDPIANVKVGSAILSDLVRRGGSVQRGLQLYVGAGNMPDDGGYGARVLAEQQRILLAARGKVDAALLAGVRVASEQSAPPKSGAMPAAVPGLPPGTEPGASKNAPDVTAPAATEPLSRDKPAADKAV
jgi:hypothetical protein